MKLYNYFRSSTSHRLRIALQLKGLHPDYVAIDLRAEQHLQEAFKAIHPQQFVPALEDDGTVFIQTPAIIEWLEETHPHPALLPRHPTQRAHVRALAALVACDIHPLNNRRVLQTLRHQFGADTHAINAWCARWIGAGFDALESLLAADTQRQGFCFGSTPTIADIYLVPQIESARRFAVDLQRWPLIMEIDTHCNTLPAFQRAAPSAQADADTIAPPPTA